MSRHDRYSHFDTESYLTQIAALQRLLNEARTRLPSEFQLGAIVTRRDSSVILTVQGVYFTKNSQDQISAQYRLSDGTNAKGHEIRLLVGADRGIIS